MGDENIGCVPEVEGLRWAGTISGSGGVENWVIDAHRSRDIQFK
jgi:hypothetical protein